MELTSLKGIGPKTADLFNKLGIRSVEDLIRAYPVHYDAYAEPVGAGEAPEGEKAAVFAASCGPVSLFSTSRRLTIVSTTVKDQTGTLRLAWYNMPYVRGRLNKGGPFIFYGLVTKGRNGRTMEHPQIFTPEAYAEKLRTLTPVYSLTKGLSNAAFGKAVYQALEVVTGQAEYLPEAILKLNGLIGEREALRRIHFPKDIGDMVEARKRLAFDEFFLFILGLKILKRQEISLSSPNRFEKGWETENVISRLPFALTKAQLTAWYEIENDLCGKTRMSRLLQGDVGSGKTILAFLALVLTAENNGQGALMAPTEVLARQHYKNLTGMIGRGEITNLKPVLLVGSQKAAERRQAEEALATGEANCVIGTHALIQSGVSYRNLALVITDEQHRFGVMQRKVFGEKGAEPHRLVMSATPIPRTLGVVFYGDMAVSILDEMPARRKRVKTCVVDTGYRPTAWKFIRKQVEEGHQAYIVCPMIEESEGFAAENVTDYAKSFKKANPDLTVGVLHGRMSAEEKDRTMAAFSEGEISVLVSTTVIEVGVDIPNATVMMVENAERFGLAALHQLRGRVGRGEAQAYCIYMAGVNSDAVMKRLDILNRSSDGMEIARYDLSLRGPGDLMGIRQSGDALFKIADVFRDEEILKAAAETAAAVMADDPELVSETYEALGEHIHAYLDSETKTIVL